MGRAKERLDTGRLGQPLGNAREEVEVVALNRYFLSRYYANAVLNPFNINNLRYLPNLLSI